MKRVLFLGLTCAVLGTAGLIGSFIWYDQTSEALTQAKQTFTKQMQTLNQLRENQHFLKKLSYCRNATVLSEQTLTHANVDSKLGLLIKSMGCDLKSLKKLTADSSSTTKLEVALSCQKDSLLIPLLMKLSTQFLSDLEIASFRLKKSLNKKKNSYNVLIGLKLTNTH